MAKKQRFPVFKVGDTVRLHFVNRYLQGRIIEDRGGLGRDGRHIYRVRATDYDDVIELELPADELQKVEAAPALSG